MRSALLLLTIFFVGCVNEPCSNKVFMLEQTAAYCDPGAVAELAIMATHPVVVCRCKER